MSVDASRATRLTKVFNNACKGQKLSGLAYVHFLQAICVQPSPATCLNAIVTSPNGITTFKNAICSDISPVFCNGLGAEVLAYFSSPDLTAIAGGDFLRRVCEAVVDPPVFWDSFITAFKNGNLQVKAQRTFATFLLRLLEILLPDAVASYRELARDPDIITPLLNSPEADIHDVAARIKAIADPFDIGFSAARTQDGPGGRHDNDKVDFRRIAIVPTIQEIRCKKMPFLRASDELEDPVTKKTRLLDYLDSQFRLLREDMLYEVREELNTHLNQKRMNSCAIDFLALDDVRYEPRSRDPRRYPWAICLSSIVDFPQLARVHNDYHARKRWLDDKKNRNFIKHQSSVLLKVDDELLTLANIHRDVDYLALNPPVIILQIQGAANISRALLRLKLAKRISIVPVFLPLFAYEPVLKAIQHTSHIPLEEELLNWSPSDPPSLVDNGTESLVDALLRNPTRDLRTILDIPISVRLDKSQVDSLILGLTQKVSLIQGPPGTGKSFIGALLAKSLYDFSSGKILVVCYTNHALDQFLEDLMKIGIPSSEMVRLGSKSTPATEPLLLRNQGYSYRRSPDEWDTINFYKERIADCDYDLEHASSQFMNTTSSLEGLLDCIELHDERFYGAFRIPERVDDMRVIGVNNKAVDSEYLIRRWDQGKDAGVFRNEPNVVETADVWRMSVPARQNKLKSWRERALQEQIHKITDMVEKYNMYVRALDSMFAAGRHEPLLHARIIGCTTTAAAMYREALCDAGPEVLLVEEAGEILESHVLTALSPKTKQLILIGDHKQLRPKVNNYLLTVEKGEGYDLNRSLFERLILKGYPHEALSQQHRMRPEISSLVRNLMYPDLVDAPSTSSRPDLRGFQSNIVFVHHEHPEGELKDLQPEQLGLDVGRKSSKINHHEVEMVLKILRYIDQQGYRRDEVVILTPYLGQLRALQTALKDTNDPVLADLDNADMIKAGLISSVVGGTSKAPIRLGQSFTCYLDNYQGEESDIVIACLTRSNDRNDIGFMFAEERLNVLLSRARNALIMIGNSNTFQNARKGKEAWKNLFDSLKAKGHFYDGVPIQCERHPSHKKILRAPEEFDQHSPNGGCLKLWCAGTIRLFCEVRGLTISSAERGYGADTNARLHATTLSTIRRCHARRFHLGNARKVML
ncbi:P-loop containing nucleoside triphosphate hydrolase protein [Punctularia strigosozonata HHB-11173 SS5]|uniref:p-loop containing nucleoside triphosphate hydrolase protein n=1 Tax=Punctularia strigosozonata (strain HHB-11173) TaxID=741275 RepID=R7RZT1_PUNST|nr:P-loop containing nucleoside triphosphate hydrolase protein [Punctularia strigosozonata HHB-11173 SS5]EIN03493.1 P-loop containing nucleoside triphosphate hydrolase protein [Punctularia strigosozonata HHB-11173 SS5]